MRVEIRCQDAWLRASRLVIVPVIIAGTILTHSAAAAVCGALVAGLIAIATVLELRTYVVADSEGITVRNRLSTRRLPWRRIERIGVAERGWPFDQVMVVIHSIQGDVPVVASQEWIGFSDTARDEVGELQRRLAALMPPRTANAP